MDDADSAVLTVAPSRAAALIGAGPTGAPLQELPGNLDFKAYNINWENRAVSTLLFTLSSMRLYDHLHVGKLRNFPGPGDRYFLLKCVILWMLFCQLSGYLVYWAEREHLCG